MDNHINNHIEALVFITQEPISTDEIRKILQEAFDTKITKGAIDNALREIQSKYESDDFAFELIHIAGGYKFMTKGAYHDTLAVFLKQASNKKLSRAALETLSIIAYKQPVVKSEIEKIRGVNCDYSIQKLLEKELVEITGRDEGPGRPLLYGTSEKFMDYFGISDIKDLPKTKDFKVADNEIGEPAPIEEVELSESTSTEEE